MVSLNVLNLFLTDNTSHSRCLPILNVGVKFSTENSLKNTVLIQLDRGGDVGFLSIHGNYSQTHHDRCSFITSQKKDKRTGTPVEWVVIQNCAAILYEYIRKLTKFHLKDLLRRNHRYMHMKARLQEILTRNCRMRVDGVSSQGNFLVFCKHTFRDRGLIKMEIWLTATSHEGR